MDEINLSSFTPKKRELEKTKTFMKVGGLKETIYYYRFTEEENTTKFANFIKQYKSEFDPIVRTDGYDDTCVFYNGSSKQLSTKVGEADRFKIYWAHFHYYKYIANVFIDYTKPEDMTLKKYIHSGKAEKELKKFMKKCRITFAKYPQIYDLSTLEVAYVSYRINKKNLTEYTGTNEKTINKLTKTLNVSEYLINNFTGNEMQIIQTWLQDNYSDFLCGITTYIGEPKEKVNKIASNMKQGNSNCLYKILEDKYGSDIPKCKKSWKKDGMNYNDLKEFGNELYEKNNIKQTVFIKDREGDNILDKPIITGIRGKNTVKAELTFYQYNNHASKEPPSISDVMTYNKNNKIEIKYVDYKTLEDTFANYEGIQYVTRNPKVLGFGLYSWIGQGHHYILEDPRIDRNKYPDALNYGHSIFLEMQENLPIMNKNHRLVNTLVKGLSKSTIETFKKGLKMARSIPIGVFNKPEKNEITYKIDMNRAYTTYDQCTYYNGYMPSVPLEEAYLCDNTILDVPGLCGTVFFKNIKLNFSVDGATSNNEFARGLDGASSKTIDYLGLQDGLLTFPEARWVRDNGSLEIYAVIPSYEVPDILPNYIARFTDEDKLLRNAFIGKFIAKRNVHTEVAADKEEADYLIGKYTENRRKYELFQLENKFIIVSEEQDYSHGKYTHLHNYIISFTRIRLWEKMKQIIDHGGKILAVRVDSITFCSKDSVKFYEKILKEPNGTIQWKHEDINVNKPLIEAPKTRKGFILNLDNLKLSQFDPIVVNQFISLEAAGGYGKTTFIKYLYKNAGFMAPTNCAAKLIKGCTLDHYMNNLSRYNAIPYRTIIIDEVSMCSIDMLKKLEYLLKKFHRNKCEWGGCQVILAGDPAQLSPVAASAAGRPGRCPGPNNEFARGLDGASSNIYDEFERGLNDVNYYRGKKFKTDFRRGDDKEFSEALLLLRKCIISGNPTAKAIDNILQLFTKVDKLPIYQNVKYICFTNESVNVINSAILKKYPEANEIIIRESKNGITNGTIIKHTNGIFTFNNEDHEIKTYKYQPAYAMTSHLTQGQTFTCPIYIFQRELIKNPRALYVALSRSTTSKNVFLF